TLPKADILLGKPDVSLTLHARGALGGGGARARRTMCARSLHFCQRIVGAAQLSFEVGARLNGKALVVDVAFDMRRSLERNAQTFDRSDTGAAHNNILGHELAHTLR